MPEKMAEANRDLLLTLEFDQHKRYTFLSQVLRAVYRENAGLGHVRPVTVLDVGSGPVSLTGMFLSERFQVTRSDVAPFDDGDANFVLLTPGQPLSLPNASYDAVVSMDVLEHVPEGERQLFLSECARVARHIAIVGCPNGDPEVGAAERRVNEVFRSLSGEDHPFLSEHFELGVPKEADIAAILRQMGYPFLVYDNVRLDQWEACLMLEKSLMAVENGQELAPHIRRSMNRNIPAGFSTGLHYRKFYVICKDGSLLGIIRAAVARITASPHGKAALYGSTYQLARFVARYLSEDADDKRSVRSALRNKMFKWASKHPGILGFATSQSGQRFRRVLSKALRGRSTR
jgi:hypothetical protein